jgi:multiple sugar transport system permease protein
MEDALSPSNQISATGSQTAPATAAPATAGGQGAATRRAVWLSGSRRRKLSEALLAYLFLLPAFLIVGLFGLFPLLFAAYQSTLRGLNKIAGRFDGLGNYITAIDSITYLLCFWGALGLVVYAGYAIFRARSEALEGGRTFGRWALPGVLIGSGVVLWVAAILRFLGPFLAIPETLRGAQATSANFRRAAFELLLEPQVQILIWAGVAAFVVGALIARRAARPYSTRNQNQSGVFAQATIMVALAATLLWLAWAEVQGAMTAALDAGEPLGLAPQLILISAGFALLGLAWVVWERGAQAGAGGSNAALLLRMGAVGALMVGAWVLIAELPIAIGRGDPTWWNGLLATVWYSMGTIPFQLAVGLLLAVLLFQPIRGKSIFRVIFFLPYIAPFVGTAAVFRILYSSRPSAPANQLLGFFNLGPLLWLNEPRGLTEVVTGASNLPGYLAGPSLALIVIILYGVWTFFGFNTVIFLAGLGSIPSETYEAAAIDGAGRWAQFRAITLPLLSPTIYFLTLYSVIGTFKAFNHIYVLRTGAALGTTDTASVVIFQTFKRDLRYGYASALAILLLLIIIVLTVINNRVASKRVFYG